MANTRRSRISFEMARARFAEDHDVFGDELSKEEKRTLATLIYYPREKSRLELSKVSDVAAWYGKMLPRLIAVCKRAARKYTRSRVRKALPEDFATSSKSLCMPIRATSIKKRITLPSSMRCKNWQGACIC